MSEAQQCPACGGGPMSFWRLAHPADAKLRGREYALERCADCGAAALAADERPGEPHRLYHEGSPAVPMAVRALRRVRDRQRLRFLRDLPVGARVFEVGAGDGRFVAALARAGYDAGGSEPYRRPDPEAAALVRRAGVEELVLAPTSQDAVLLWHVLEHLDEPAAALRRIRGWLAPGGKLLVAVPNMASLQASLGGDRWFQQDVPRHAVHFTPAGLERLLHRCGFKAARLRHTAGEQNLVAMWQTLLNCVTTEPNVAYRLVHANGGRPARRDVVAAALAGTILLPIAVTAELAAVAARRAGSIVAEAVAP